MSELIESSETKPISWILPKIATGEMALPDFQRDFVWDPTATQELIVSLAQNYPAGALLAIRRGSRSFVPREFEGAPPLDGGKPEYLILDGQQRLTSLYQALCGAGEYKYYVKLRDLMSGKDFEDSVFHLRSTYKRGAKFKEFKKYEEFAGQADDLVLPLSLLFASRDGFARWADDVAERIDDQSERRSLKSKLQALRDQFIKPIEEYRFPFILLTEETPAPAVCTIFETLNRTGMKLGIFDLLAARLWAENVKLRDLWEEAKQENQIIADYEVDPYYLLQVLALTVPRLPAGDGKVAQPSCKKKDVLALDPSDVSQRWHRVIEAMTTALEMLRDDFGVMVPKWLPYGTILVPLAALLYRHRELRGVDVGILRQRLRRWYWCSVFSQAYDSAANSRAATDFVAVDNWVTGGGEPESVSRFTFDSSVLSDTTPKQRARYNGVICLILSRNPRDFHSQKPIVRSMLGENGIDDHHIFPSRYLEQTGVQDARVRDTVLNRTLIDRETNQRLSKNPPSTYFQAIRKTLSTDVLAALLGSHLIPCDDGSPVLTDKYSEFLAARETLLGDLIGKVTSA